MMIKKLKKYIIKNNLHKKAIEDFWIAFNNWKNNHPEDYKISFNNISHEELDVFIHAIGLKSSQWPECDYSHVTITIFIHYKDIQLGCYTDLFSLGTADGDDFLEIY